MHRSAQILLQPFSQLYGGITRLRNYLYDQNIMQSRRFNLPVIAVGNLTVGGTGKTPHVEYLLRLLHQYKVATLSRGYKRQSKGFILADERANPALIGDEPYQYYADFKEVAVAVCEDRVKGVEELQERLPKLDVVVLDDAMQHRPVQPSLNILITDYNRPFYRDFVLPAGRLREPRSGAKRASVVVVSKCPQDLDKTSIAQIKGEIATYTKAATPVFFSSFAYASPVPIGNSATLSERVILVTGIANAAPLKKYLSSINLTVTEHIAYPDHHHYTSGNLQELQRLMELPANKGASILTTRKDAVKLTDASLIGITEQLPIFYLPIKVQFLADQDAFDQLILQHVHSFE